MSGQETNGTPVAANASTELASRRTGMAFQRTRLAAEQNLAQATAAPGALSQDELHALLTTSLASLHLT